MSQQTYPGHSPTQSKPEPEEVNPVTQKRYKRQAWWQVTFPVIVVAVIVVALLVLLAVLGGPPALSIVADFSLALLCLLAALPVLVVLAIFGGLVFLMVAMLLVVSAAVGMLVLTIRREQREARAREGAAVPGAAGADAAAPPR